MPLREHVAAADDQHPGRLCGGVAQRGGQPATLAGRHRPVVEVEGQHADGAVPLVADLAVPSRGPPVDRRAASPRGRRRGAVARAIVAGSFVGAGRGADLADPHATVAGADEDGVVRGGARSCRARRRAPGRGGRRRPTPVDHRASCRDAGRSVGGADATQDRVGAVGPRELAVGRAASSVVAARSRRVAGSPAARARTSGRPPWRPPRGSARSRRRRPGRCTRRSCAGASGVERKRSAIAQIGPASISSTACSAVTPHAISPVDDRPVERRRATVTLRSGVHDDRPVAASTPRRAPARAGTGR